MSVAASLPPTSVVAPASLPTPTPADRDPSPHPFAQLLQQSRGIEPPGVDAAKPGTAKPGTAKPGTAKPGTAKPGTAKSATPRAEPGPEPAMASDESVATTDSAPRGEGSGRARARTGAPSWRSTARAADAAERPERGPERSTERSTERAAQGDDRAPADTAIVAANPALAVGSNPARPVDPEPRSAAAAQGSPPVIPSGGRDVAAMAAPTPVVDSGAPADRAETRQSGAAAVAHADTDRGAARARDSDAATPAASFTQILADAKAADRPAAAPAAAETPPLPAAATATAIAAHEPQAPVTADSARAPQAATLPVPIDSPQFPAALGVQVSVFVREGVQQAELHLNPVETGPVSIAISLDGTQARVEFGADLAATRQAIENGLPALASALRDAGFTLAGGGVAQHARSGGGGPGGDDPAGRDRPDRRASRGGERVATPAAVQRASHRVAAGGIDLYA